MDEQDARIAQVFGTKEVPEVSPETLLKYRQYLLDRLDRSAVLRGEEDFPWEEFYVLGPGNKAEYEKMKQTNLSYTDDCQLVGISADEYFEGNDLLAEVKRLSDGKVFEIGLSWLCTKGKGPTKQLLHDYSCWAVNW